MAETMAGDSIRTMPCTFLDGPYRGTREVRVQALQEGMKILSDMYVVQWNGEDMRWEAVTP